MHANLSLLTKRALTDKPAQTDGGDDGGDCECERQPGGSRQARGRGETARQADSQSRRLPVQLEN